jgi:hypothetical protein
MLQSHRLPIIPSLFLYCIRSSFLILKTVFRIRNTDPDPLIRSLVYGSGSRSCSFHQWLSRCRHKISVFFFVTVPGAATKAAPLGTLVAPSKKGRDCETESLTKKKFEKVRQNKAVLIIRKVKIIPCKKNRFQLLYILVP